MAVQRVAIIFDNVQRPETTGGYCLRALKDLVEVEHFQPSELDRIPRAGFDRRDRPQGHAAQGDQTVEFLLIADRPWTNRRKSSRAAL